MKINRHIVNVQMNILETIVIIVNSKFETKLLCYRLYAPGIAFLSEMEDAYAVNIAPPDA